MEDSATADRTRRNKPATLGLQVRATVLIVMLTLGVTAVAFGFWFSFARNLTRNIKIDEAYQAAAMLARAAEPYLKEGRIDALSSLAQEFTTNSSICYLGFADASGTPLVEVDGYRSSVSGMSTATHMWLDNDSLVGALRYVESPYDGSRQLRVTYPVRELAGNEGSVNPSGLLGYVRVGMTLEPLLLQLSSASDVASGVGTAALLLTIPLAYLVVRRIVVPLDEISRTAARLAGGELNARSKVRRGDEIGQLALSFNAMADRLVCAHEEARQLNADLERRVRERTKQLADLADREPLTGLYNRRYFKQRLQLRHSEAVRYGNDLSCMMLDIDNFKQVNDTLGHTSGDEILQLLANIIAGQLRAADLAARYGGDEFVILLPQTSAERARVLGQRVIERFTQEAHRCFPGVHCGVSIGVASLADVNHPDSEGLIQAADKALYESKQQGKCRVTVAVGI